MPLITVDERLKTAAEMAGEFSDFADIGADHGKLSVYLLQLDSSRHALISDISAPSLEKAREAISRNSLENRVVFCVADGIDSIAETRFSPQIVFILGMGGETLSGILKRGLESMGDADLIVSAHTEIPMLRSTIYKAGYHIVDERIACSAGRHYILMRAHKGSREASERDILLGPVLVKNRPENWKPVLLHQEKVLVKALTMMQAKNKDQKPEHYLEYTKELGYIREMLEK